MDKVQTTTITREFDKAGNCIKEVQTIGINTPNNTNNLPAKPSQIKRV